MQGIKGITEEEIVEEGPAGRLVIPHDQGPDETKAPLAGLVAGPDGYPGLDLEAYALG